MNVHPKHSQELLRLSSRLQDKKTNRSPKCDTKPYNLRCHRCLVSLAVWRNQDRHLTQGYIFNEKFFNYIFPFWQLVSTWNQLKWLLLLWCNEQPYIDGALFNNTGCWMCVKTLTAFGLTHNFKGISSTWYLILHNDWLKAVNILRK